MVTTLVTVIEPRDLPAVMDALERHGCHPHLEEVPSMGLPWVGLGRHHLRVMVPRGERDWARRALEELEASQGLAVRAREREVRATRWKLIAMAALLITFMGLMVAGELSDEEEPALPLLALLAIGLVVVLGMSFARSRPRGAPPG